MSLGLAAMVMRRVPGYASLQPDPEQVEEAKKLRRAKAAADAPPKDISNQVPVFFVPGVHIMLPSRRGDVCLTPLFLNRQQLDSTAAALQDLIVRHRRVIRPIDRRMRRMAVESVAAEFMGLPDSSTPGRQHRQGGNQAPEELEQGSGSSGIQHSEPGGLTAAISRAVVGALSAALRAREAGANAVDSFSSRLDLDARLAGHRRRPVVKTHSLSEYIMKCGCCNNIQLTDGSPSLQPWTQEDIESMQKGVSTTIGMAVKAFMELQQQGRTPAQASRPHSLVPAAVGFGANMGLTMSLPDVGRLQIEQDRAFGRVPASATDEAPIMGPNRGVILIGDINKPEGDAESGDKPRYVQLSDGRKIRDLAVTLTDGNVLATCR